MAWRCAGRSARVPMCRSCFCRRAPMKSIASSAWRSAATIMSASRSVRANWSRACKRFSNAPSARQTAASEVKELAHGAARVDLYGHGAYWKDKPVSLTATEFAILKSLLREPQRVFSRDRLMDAAYDGQVSVSDRTIDSHMRNLRAKYAKAGCKDLIETVHGVGYKLGSCR